MAINCAQLKDKIVIICGPTASGKSAIALDIAKETNGVVINADSMQVYKELPILTAQPTLLDHLQVLHKLYGIIETDTAHSVARWLDLVKKEIKNCQEKDQLPIIVGGSGLYIKALIDGLAFIPSIGEFTKSKVSEMLTASDPISMYKLLVSYDPELAQRIAVFDLQRVTRGLAVYLETKIPLSKWQSNTKPYFPRDKFFVINLDIENALLYRNCNSRFIEMLNIGAIEEVELLLKQKPGVKYPKILGLYELIDWLQGSITREEASEKAQRLIRNYAKRQITWFKKQISYDFFLRKG